MFRRLCREAVIFMLLGLVLAAVGSFVYMHHSEAASIQGRRDALKRNCDLLARGPAGATVIEQDGIVLVTAAECRVVFGTDAAHGGYVDSSPGLVPKKSESSPDAQPDKIEGLPAGAVVKPLPAKPAPPPGYYDSQAQKPPRSLPANFFDQQQDMLTEGTRIKNLKVDNLSNTLAAAIIGLYGFAGGFGVWLFYRLVRFAVKG